MTSTDTRELARHVEAGHQLVPLHGWDARDEAGRERGKSPLHRNWTRRPYRSEEQVGHMAMGGNVGVRLTAAQLVLDVDPRSFEPVWEGVDPFVELVLRLGLDPDEWPRVETGSGGSHYYMTKPEDVSVRDSLPEFPGVEFKSLGRQVVAAGSVHPCGRRYEWDFLSPDPSEAPRVPEALLDLIARPSGAASAAGGGEHTAEEVGRMLEALDPEDFGEHDAWLTLMQACHHASGGEARQEFVEWSAGDPLYADHGAVVGRRWDSLDASPSGAAVTFRTLHKLLRDAGREDAIPRSAAEDDFEGLDDEGENGREKGPLERMNEAYCAVNMEGKFRVAYQVTDVDPEDGRERTRWCFSSRQSFEDLHMHRRLETPDGKAKPLGKAWLEWRERLQADGVVFDPSTPDRIANGKLNLWTGFSCEPMEGDWSHIRWLVEEALCAGDRTASEYVLDWIAWKVQNPDRLPGVALAFKGAKGTGKTTLGDLVATLFGSHGLVLSQREHLTGKFNAHLGTACFALCDEVDFRHTAGREDSQLKKIVTDRASMIEGKGRDPVASTNRLGVMLASNADVIVPASADERRYAVFDVPDTWGTGDGAPNVAEARRRHAAVHEQIRSGGREAFLHAMLNRRVEAHPRECIPATAALAGQKAAGLPLVQRWFLAASEEGHLPQPFDFQEGEDDGWEASPQYTTYAEVADAVMRFAREEGVRHKRPSAKSVLHDLAAFGVRAAKHRQVRAWSVPDLDTVRRAWAAHLGGSPFGDD